MALPGKCVFKSKCGLNCQVFVLKENESLARKSTCLACGHLAAFHEQSSAESSPAGASTASTSSGNNTSSLIPIIDLSNNCRSAAQTSSTGTFGRVKTFAEWKERKSSSSYRKKKGGKLKPVVEEVTINIGIMQMESDTLLLKPKWGKRLPLKIKKAANHKEILENGLAKWKTFNKNMIEEGEKYMLLYEDGSDAVFLPGQQKEFFTLSAYKEALGNDYRRIVLFLCKEKDYECNYSYHVLGECPLNTDPESEDEFEKGINIESQENPTKKKKVDIASSESFLDEISEMQNVSNNMNFPSTPPSSCDTNTAMIGTCAVPDEFLWGDWDEVEEDELVKAAIARSLDNQSNKTEDIELLKLIEEFQKQEINQFETCSVVVLRKKLLQACMRAVQEKSFEFMKVPCIVFSGEDSADVGGPRREFFRLLVQAVCKDLGVFEGNPHSLVFSHDHSVIASRKPFLAGQLIAWSILHGGPGPQSLSEDTFYLMLDLQDDVVATRAANVIPDEAILKLSTSLVKVDSDEELQVFKRANTDWLLDQGISLHGIGKEELLMQVIKQSLFYRVKPSIDLFLNGMDSVGQFLSMFIRRNPKAFLPLFTDSAPLTILQLKGLYHIKWSEEGSNNRAEEEDTIYCWENFLKQVSEHTIEGCSLEDILVFTSGADKVPPLGFSRLITVSFYDQEDEHRRPWSSTCGLELHLPRGIEDTEAFNGLMVSALKESCGFGKV